MDLRFKRATLGEIESCLELMERYYRTDHLRFDREKALSALTALIANPIFGRIWLFSEGAMSGNASAYIGYLALTYGYSLESGGRNAFVDELYVIESHRGRGVGTAAIAHALVECRAEGVGAVRLEVTKSNSEAHRLYERIGFRDLGRSLLVSWADPSASSEILSPNPSVTP